MGRNNQQRRADKKRRAARQQRTVRSPAGDPLTMRLDEAAMENLVLMAARVAFGTGEDRTGFAEAVSALLVVETSPAASNRPTSAVANLLCSCVANLYENGWQPADIAHAVKRQWTVRASRLAIAVIASEARHCDAAQRAPSAWLSQLEDLGVYDPARQAVVGGHDPLAGWARSERLNPDESLTISLQVLAQLMMSSRETMLMEPPSAWGATNRGVIPKVAAAHGDIDAKALKLIRALLAKAEATTFEHEAEAFTAKAQEMMTRYSIDAAVLASAGRNRNGVDPDIESRRFHIDSPYADEKASFLSVIASVNGARCIWSPHVGFATVMGFAVDLQLTDLLFTSLLVQATRSSAEATATDRRLRTPSFRRAFLIAFADRIGERLEATKQHASAEAEQQYGSALLPILASRQAAVEEAYTQAFPNAKPMRSRRLNAHGWHAGRAAADRANIGHGQAIAPA
jgi:Protein of unknown function (DUF2786)